VRSGNFYFFHSSCLNSTTKLLWIKLTIYLVRHAVIFVISKILYKSQEIYLLMKELSGKFENCHLLNVKKE
jgi:hypothetical protein